MRKKFNITGLCRPEQHYMVDLTSRLEQIKEYVDEGNYFVINRGRQYGKTTTLRALARYLSDEYIIVNMDFQVSMSNTTFQDEITFSNAFAVEFLDCLDFLNETDLHAKALAILGKCENLVDLFKKLSKICHLSAKPIVLLIDEVDSASNNQIFLDFLAQLRGYYLNRDLRSTFQSVILAGVHDIRNLRQKIRPDSEHKHNSPWNIAAPFEVEMSFSPTDIAGMLEDYESDHHTGMNVQEIAQLIYDYTSGYPVLVSMICKLMDEKQEVWSAENIKLAVKRISGDQLPLFESLINKIENDDMLRKLLYTILFQGKSYPCNMLNDTIKTAAMYGFVSNHEGTLQIANRIFETVLYDWFISMEMTDNQLTSAGVRDKSQFISGGQLDMERVLEKFVIHFTDLYGTQPDQFKESDGRKLFLLYLRPIINGTGNYYIEAQTRDQRRTDVIVDYHGKQYIIELKIWHGEEYNSRGEQQLCEYLDYYRTDKGYLLSFNFNQKKQVGVQTIHIGDKMIVEAVV